MSRCLTFCRPSCRVVVRGIVQGEPPCRAPHRLSARAPPPAPPRRRSCNLARAKSDMKARRDPVFSAFSWFRVTSAPRKVTRNDSGAPCIDATRSGARGASGSCGYGAPSRSCLKVPWPYRWERARCPSLPKRLRGVEAILPRKQLLSHRSPRLRALPQLVTGFIEASEVFGYSLFSSS